MIKKILLSLSIIGLTLFGYSYAMFPSARDCTRIGNGYSYCIFELDIPNEFGYAYAGGREGFILNNVLDGQLNLENNQIILQDNNDVNRNLTFGRNNGKLYGITSYQGNSIIYGQGYIKICESTYNDNGFINDCYFNNPNANYSIDYNNLNLNASFDKYIYINTDYNGRIDWINENGMFCFADTNNDYSLCFLYYIGNPDYGYQMFTGFNNLISNVQSGTGERYTIFDNSSPFNGGGGFDGGFNGNVEISNSDIVSYYEDTRGFNYNMCFVGTWDFSSNTGTFKQGNGEHIFSYFNWFYNLGTGNNASGYKLSDVGDFIDEMYGNYDIYFNYGNRYSNGDIAYIYKFDINTHTLDWVDTGYNNPFDVNTYVYTFYPKTLHYYTDYWRLYYYGGDLANYCYYKLNLNNSPQEDIYGNLENDISQADLNNIGDWKVISNNLKPNQSGNVISVSEDWHGSPLDYFAVENGSGYEDFDVSTFFSESFNRFKGVFGELNPGDFGFGYLPGYIITFMLALILFRFLSH